MNELREDHRKVLEQDSGISSEVIAARGYRTVTVKAELEKLGFSRAQQRVPALLIPIHDVTGRVATHQIRPDNPCKIKGKKGGKERTLKYETPKGSSLCLDVNPRSREKLSDPSIPLYITEGSKKVDALVSRGLCAFGIMGVYGFRGKNEHGGLTALADWESVALNNRPVYLAFDSDVTTKPEVYQALKRLKAFLEQHSAKVKVIYLPDDGEGKTGVDDYLARSHRVKDLIALASEELRPSPGEDVDDGNTPPTQSQSLVELALEKASKFFHDGNENTFALIPVADYYEVMRLKSKAFRTMLNGLFYTAHGKPPGSQAMQDALGVLEARARFDGELHPVFVRIAEHQGRVYLDLGNERWNVVEIDERGWRILARSPVRFIRPKGLQALPTPVAGGRVEGLRDFVHLEDDDWYLLLAYLVACLYPRGPFPLLLLTAEQGSGKTTLARIIKALLDANAAPVRSTPRDERDLMIAAQNSWLLCFDNLSGISSALSDALARLATGAGFSTRELHSDSEEVIFAASRPLLLTAIDDVVGRSDLLDRAITLNLKRLENGTRRTERDLWRDLGAALPGVLGALLDAVTVGIRNLPTTPIVDTRMSDFATFAAACEPGLGLVAGTISKAYKANREGATAVVLESSPITPPLVKLMEAQQPDLKSEATLETTSGDLLPLLVARADEAARRHKSWPNSARALSGVLRRLAPNLREVGIAVEFASRSSSKRTIVITYTPPKPEDNRKEQDGKIPSRPSRPSPTPQKGRERHESEGDGSRDGLPKGDGSKIQPSPLPSSQEPREGRDRDGGDDSDGQEPSSSKWQGIDL